MARPKKQPEQTTVPAEEIAANQVAPDQPVEVIVPALENTAAVGIASSEVSIAVIAPPVTQAPETFTESPQTTTLAVEPVIEFKPADTVVVNKEALYRMLVGLARGHTQSYTYERAKQMVGKLFGIEGEEFQKKWEEIKQFIG